MSIIPIPRNWPCYPQTFFQNVQKDPIELTDFVVRKSAWIKDRSNVSKIIINQHNYLQILIKFLRARLDAGQYIEVAHALWGKDNFNPEPYSVRLIWANITDQAECLIMGPASCGKSYDLAAWSYLDWFRDPEYTCFKILSVTKQHAQRNVFAHIQNLHRMASVPLPCKAIAGSLQVGTDEKQGIHLLAIPYGDSGKGRLRGFHPVPRPFHHQFGHLSRVRAVLDEAEEIGEGVWEDCDNILATKHDTEHVRILAATNPSDRTSKFGQRCEPVGGWSRFDIDTSSEWKSALGWKVIRIDGAKIENVKERREVYPGLLTWDGYQRFLALGENSPSYFTMARGCFPMKGTFDRIFPANILDKMRGEYIFTGNTTPCGGVDLAMNGGDATVLTIGRFGMALGYKDLDTGVDVMFPQRKLCLQVEGQMEVPKEDSVKQAESLTNICKQMGITDMYFAADYTGVGTGCVDIMKYSLGENIIAVHYGSSATEEPLTEESQERACDLYDGVVTELFFGLRVMAEHDYIKLLKPAISSELMRELGDRRYKGIGKAKVRIESKDDYKARGNTSPDRADSMTLLSHVFRLRNGIAKLQTAPDRYAREFIDIEKLIDFDKGFSTDEHINFSE